MEQNEYNPNAGMTNALQPDQQPQYQQPQFDQPQYQQPQYQQPQFDQPQYQQPQYQQPQYNQPQYQQPQYNQPQYQQPQYQQPQYNQPQYDQQQYQQPQYNQPQYNQPQYDQYAAPAPAPAPKKKKTGLIIGIIAGVLVLAGAAVAALLLLGKPKVQSVTVNKTSVELFRQGTETVTATILPEKAAENAEIHWSSSDPSVAGVDQNGKISAIGGGTCTITVTAGEQSASVNVKVSQANETESIIVGRWEAVFGASSGSSGTSLRGADWPLILKDDLTGTMKIGDETHNITWAYDRVDDDGDTWFTCRRTDSSAVAYLIYDHEDHDLMYLLSSGDEYVAVSYER